MTADRSNRFNQSARRARSRATARQPITQHRLFPAVVALWLGAAGLLGSFVVPQWRIESLVTAIGLPSLVPAAMPPLGMTARLLIGLLIGGTMATAGLLIARRMFSAPKPVEDVSREPEAEAAVSGSLVGGLVSKLKRRKDANAVHDFDDLPKLRDADRHPDAPARRPFQAARDLAEAGTGENELHRRRRQLALDEDAADNHVMFIDSVPVPGASPAQAQAPVQLDESWEEAEAETAAFGQRDWTLHDDAPDNDMFEDGAVDEGFANRQKAGSPLSEAPFAADPDQLLRKSKDNVGDVAPAITSTAAAWDDIDATPPFAAQAGFAAPASVGNGQSIDALLQRLAIAISDRVDRLDRVAKLNGSAPSPSQATFAAPAVATAPIVADHDADGIDEDEDDSDDDLILTSEIESEADEDAPGCSSLLDIPYSPALRERTSFIQTDMGNDSADYGEDDDDYEPVVIFPGQERGESSQHQSNDAAPSRAFDAPQRPLEARSDQPAPDPEEMDRALKAALATLQRMTGT